MSKRRKNNSKLNRKRFNCFITILVSCLVILTIIGRNMYVSTKCKDALYAIDYYMTNYKDKSLRLLKVESLSVVENNDGKLIIDAYGISYSKPYLKINILGTFERDVNGKWQMTDINLKNDDEKITNTN